MIQRRRQQYSSESSTTKSIAWTIFSVQWQVWTRSSSDRCGHEVQVVDAKDSATVPSLWYWTDDTFLSCFAWLGTRIFDVSFEKKTCHDGGPLDSDEVRNMDKRQVLSCVFPWYLEEEKETKSITSARHDMCRILTTSNLLAFETKCVFEIELERREERWREEREEREGRERDIYGL